MTPKEKAKELAIKFINSTDVVKPNLASIEKALLCVNELYKMSRSLSGENYIYFTKFWQEVKHEIEKL